MEEDVDTPGREVGLGSGAEVDETTEFDGFGVTLGGGMTGSEVEEVP